MESSTCEKQFQSKNEHLQIDTPAPLSLTSYCDIIPESVVLIRHACFQFGRSTNSTYVLNDFNMRVPKGLIYALLGPSGCGKTTLLSCIVGIKKIQSGKMFVLGHDISTKNLSMPRSIGYMPQEVSLYTFFTINETFQYFGMIHGLTNDEINKQIEFYSELLDLPHKNRFIKALSGGEYRRVSLAVTLLHKPEILILDEPTVGVDALLRKGIWDYLKQLVNEEQISIIITTHYIEEARQADTVGLMRYGSLLTESSPKDLLFAYNCTSLEQVFLKLCSEQPTTNNSDNTAQINNEIIIASSVQPTNKKPPNAPYCGKFKATLMKNFYRHLRNPLMIAIVCIIPLFQAVLFVLCIGTPATNLKVAIVNDEVPSAFANNTCPVYDGCKFRSLSCRFLNYVDSNTMTQVTYENLDAGKNAVRKGKAWNVIYFRSNFSTSLRKRLFTNMQNNDVYEYSEISIWSDNSVSENSIQIEFKLRLALKSFLNDLLLSCNQNPRYTTTPLAVKGVWGDLETTTHQNFLVPALTMSIVFLLSIMPTSGNIINERNQGLIQRSVISGVPKTVICLSHFITEAFVILIQTSIILFIMIIIFQIEYHGSLFLIYLLIFIQGYSGVAFGVFLSQVCDKEFTTTFVGMGIGYPLLCVSGIIWPLEGIPLAFRQFCEYLPLTHGILAQRGVFIKGWTIDQPEVILGIMSLCSWMGVFLIVACIFAYLKR